MGSVGWWLVGGGWKPVGDMLAGLCSCIRSHMLPSGMQAAAQRCLCVSCASSWLGALQVKASSVCVHNTHAYASIHTHTNTHVRAHIHTLSRVHPCAQMLDDLRDQCNEFVADSVMDIKAPRPYDPMLSDQYIGIANYGKVRTHTVTPLK
eukprot:1158817-Pelagomonas_calceolata.AAC.1